jgi:hypothetical protein
VVIHQPAAAADALNDERAARAHGPACAPTHKLVGAQMKSAGGQLERSNDWRKKDSMKFRASAHGSTFNVAFT